MLAAIGDFACKNSNAVKVVACMLDVPNRARSLFFAFSSDQRSVFAARGRKLGAIASDMFQKMNMFRKYNLGLLLYKSAAQKSGWRFTGRLNCKK